MTVYKKIYTLPDFDSSEILRYARVKESDLATDRLLFECCDMLKELSGAVCFCEVPVKVCQDGVNLDFVKVKSTGLAKNLKNCQSAVIFAATAGAKIDRLIEKYNRIDLSRAVMLQAVGTERVEALCDLFSRDIELQKKQKGEFTRPRFSPGYGDLPLEIQRDIFRVLDPFKNIGVSLCESLLMTPSKSVTAIIGVGKTPCKNLGGCEYCDKTDCNFRKEQ